MEGRYAKPGLSPEALKYLKEHNGVKSAKFLGAVDDDGEPIFLGIYEVEVLEPKTNGDGLFYAKTTHILIEMIQHTVWNQGLKLYTKLVDPSDKVIAKWHEETSQEQS